MIRKTDSLDLLLKIRNLQTLFNSMNLVNFNGTIEAIIVNKENGLDDY